MSKISTGAVFLAAGALVAATSGPALSAAVKLKTITGLLQTNPMTKSFLGNFRDQVNAQCTDKVSMQYLGSHNVIHPTQGGKAVMRGQFDALHSPTSYYLGLVPEGYGMLASNLPIEEIHRNGGWEMLTDIYRKRAGAKLVAWGETNLGYNTYLVEKPKFDSDGVPDLSGTKMRATGTYRPLFQALGASTINMKSSEIYTALQRGVVSGFGWPSAGVPSLGLHKLVKYRVEPPYYRSNTVVTMNQKRWDSLSSAQKSCINKVAREYERTSQVSMTKAINADNEIMRKAGVEVINLKGRAATAYLTKAYDGAWRSLEKRTSPETAAAMKAKLYRAPGS